MLRSIDIISAFRAVAIMFLATIPGVLGSIANTIEYRVPWLVGCAVCGWFAANIIVKQKGRELNGGLVIFCIAGAFLFSLFPVMLFRALVLGIR